MEGILTKVLLIVAGLALFVVVIVGVIQPSISAKGDAVKTSIDATSTSTLPGN